MDWAGSLLVPPRLRPEGSLAQKQFTPVMDFRHQVAIRRRIQPRSAGHCWSPKRSGWFAINRIRRVVSMDPVTDCRLALARNKERPRVGCSRSKLVPGREDRSHRLAEAACPTASRHCPDSSRMADMMPGAGNSQAHGAGLNGEKAVRRRQGYSPGFRRRTSRNSADVAGGRGNDQGWSTKVVDVPDPHPLRPRRATSRKCG